MTVMPPSDWTLVQAIVMLTAWLSGAFTSQVFVKSSRALLADLLMLQMFAVPCDALMSLLMLWGRISLTGMETSRAPIPAVPISWFAKFAWSDEPGNR